MNFNLKRFNFINILIFLFCIFMLSSCQDPMFYYVRKEVPLEASTVQGDITAIVRFQDDIYVANGNIFSKNKNISSHGSWNKKNKPSGFAIKVAANQNYIYVLMGVVDEDLDSGYNEGQNRKLYASSNGSSWTQIKDFGHFNNNVKTILFCTNDVDPTKRKAYINENGTVYELTNVSYPSSSCGSGNVRSATSDGTLHTGWASTSVNVPINGTNTDCYYWSDGSTLHYKVGSKTGSTKPGIGDIYSIAVTSNAILLGTEKGLGKVSNNNGIPGSAQSFETNADSTLSSQYEIWALLSIDPTKSETSDVIYASMTYQGYGKNSAQFTHIGLWSYMPSRGNWNRE